MSEQWIWMKHEDMPDAEPVRTPKSSLVSLHSRNGWFEVDSGGDAIPVQAMSVDEGVEAEAEVEAPKPKAKPSKPSKPSPSS